MTETGADRENLQIDLFVETWAGCTAEVISQVAGRAFSAKATMIASDMAISESERGVVFLAAADGGLRGEFVLRISRVSAQLMGQLLLGEAPDTAAEFRPDFMEAAEELTRQISGQAATKITATQGEVHLRVATATAPTWSPAVRFTIEISSADLPGASATLELSAALVASLRSKTLSPPNVTTQQNAATTNLSSFMNVQLGVTLRFGCRQMLLRDVLDLNAGAVFELDRKLEAPVDLLLDGRLIARGEVVVVDGNYGLRVTELAVSTEAS